MTGLPRSFAVNVSTSQVKWALNVIPSGHPARPLTSVVDWAGPVGDEHPGWLVAHSIRNHVLEVLADHGGYDLFILEPGRADATPDGAEKWNVLRLNASRAGGIPNRMFVLHGGPEPDLWFNQSDPRWKQFYHTKRYGFRHAYGIIQGELYQVKHQLMCNAAVREHEQASGIPYKYKMRLRPDFAWARDIPPPSRLSSLASEDTIVVSDHHFWPGGNNDTFAFGLAGPMDAYFDKAPHIHDFKWIEGWQNEIFTETYMASRGISFRGHKDINMFVVRTDGFRRGTRPVKGDADPDANATKLEEITKSPA